MWGQESRAPVAVGAGNFNLAASDWLHRRNGSIIGGEFAGNSAESEHDLATMVKDFCEIGSAGADSWYSSDSDSSFSDLAFLSDKISLHKHTLDQYESDLILVVNSLILSLSNSRDIRKSDACNASTIRYSLVKLLQSSGYDAAICATKWHGLGNIPGGEHEFIDVIFTHQNSGCSERCIIDIDFRSHFQIARAIKSYNVLLNSLPSIYVGSTTKLKQFLQIMVEAARYSLEQNSMPLPPWRSLAYLEAKWESPCERIVNLLHQHLSRPLL
ncbi:unnamed protein product [Fraxinus pennsylvanica]|uniref:Uncharacterized protein n=1 Tax=Fraxinus pennsylvanica TaxID=56036 RepID=A0AAD2DWR3_9LAMI|nr:unnamed protein product [Fraxinus pennsylvanica]